MEKIKKTMTKRAVHDVYAIMAKARLADLKSIEDKAAVLSVLREMRTVAISYEEDAREANEGLKPKGYDVNLRKAISYEKERETGKQPTAMTSDEYDKFIQEHNEYQRAKGFVMRDVDTKKVELEFEPVGSSVLETLMSANGWTVEQYFFVEDAMK